MQQLKQVNKTQRFLKAIPGLFVLNAFKCNTTVIMTKKLYHKKPLTYLMTIVPTPITV